MKTLDMTEQSNRAANPNEKPENCYCSALPKGSPCLPCYKRWLAGGARKQSGLALPSIAGARTANFYDATDRDIVYPNLGIY